MSEAPATLGDLGAPLVAARSAEIYAWKPGQILKLFRTEISTDMARWERINAEEAHARGATRVSCHGEVVIDGRYGIIMSRLEGGTLTKSTDANPLNLFRIPGILARLHAVLHDARTSRLRDVRQVIAGFLDQKGMGFLTDRERQVARDYVLALPDGSSLLHMDYHTDNILVAKGEATVIDWATAARGEAGADLAMTWFLFHEAELFPGISKLEEFTYNFFRKFIYRGYARRYKALRKLPAAEFGGLIDRWYLPALIYRLAAWEAPTEVARLRRQIRERIAGLPGMGHVP